MYNSPTTKVLVAVSEQVFEPMQVPILIGNEIFIVTQQDIRKIEDSRHLSFRRLNNDNINKNENNINNSHIFDAININNAFILREESTVAEQQYNQYLQQNALNFNMSNEASSSIQMQVDLEKQGFNNQTFDKCNTCMSTRLIQPSLVNRCEKVLKCRGVNTDTLSSNWQKSDTKCESISARDQLKLKKKYENTMAI